MRTPGAVTSLAAISLLVLWLYTTPEAFSDPPEPPHLPDWTSLLPMTPADRRAAVADGGHEGWKQRFKEDVEASVRRGSEPPTLETQRNAFLRTRRMVESLRMAYLTRDPDLVEPLRKYLLEGDDLPRRYLAALAIERSGADDEFLLDLLDHRDANVAFCAICTIGTRDDEPVRMKLRKIAQERRAAVMQMDLDRWDSVESQNLIYDGLRRLHRLERLRSQFTALKAPREKLEFLFLHSWAASDQGVINFFDGEPSRVWLLEQWVQISRESPEAVASFIANDGIYVPPAPRSLHPAVLSTRFVSPVNLAAMDQGKEVFRQFLRPCLAAARTNIENR